MPFVSSNKSFSKNLQSFKDEQIYCHDEILDIVSKNNLSKFCILTDESNAKSLKSLFPNETCIFSSNDYDFKGIYDLSSNLNLDCFQKSFKRIKIVNDNNTFNTFHYLINAIENDYRCFVLDAINNDELDRFIEQIYTNSFAHLFIHDLFDGINENLVCYLSIFNLFKLGIIKCNSYTVKIIGKASKKFHINTNNLSVLLNETDMNDFVSRLNNIQDCNTFKSRLNDFSLIENLKQYTSNLEKKLIVTLYLKYPPLRRDYCEIKIRNYDKLLDNFYENGILTFNHLNKNFYGTITVVLDDIDKKLCELLIESQPITDNYLFIHNDANKIEKRKTFISRNLKKYSLEIIGQEFSIDDYRESYASNSLNKFKKQSLGYSFEDVIIFMKNLAQSMNHTISGSLDFYIYRIE